MVKLHVYYEHMRIVRHMLITICRTTMLDLSQITKQLYTKRLCGCGGGRWRIDPQFLSHSMVDISLWSLA